MSDITRILSAIDQGDPHAADDLLPLVYDELRKLAAAKLSREQAATSMEATALVHDAYVRMVGVGEDQHWNGRGHFFGAAAEAMRRILVERARRKQTSKRGGDRQRVPFAHVEPQVKERTDELLAVHEALDRLGEHNPDAAELVKLRYFVGFGQQEAAAAMGIGRRTADGLWAIARARLRTLIRDN